MSKPILTQKEARYLFEYNPWTGELTWSGNKKWTTRGTRAGYLNSFGYWVVMIDGFNYSTGRIVWIYAYGTIPFKLQVDHEDHDRGNNKLHNLRLVTNQQNQMNRRFTGNSSGFRGVYRDKTRNKWAPKIKVNQEILNLGRFDTLSEAIGVRLTAELEYGFHPNHGS